MEAHFLLQNKPGTVMCLGLPSHAGSRSRAGKGHMEGRAGKGRSAGACAEGALEQGSFGETSLPVTVLGIE